MTLPNIHSASVFARRDLAWREVAGETVVVDADGKVIMGLNGTGGHVWERLDGRRTLAEIAAELAEQYGVGADAVLDDVLAFARQLAERNLLVRAGG